MKSPLGYLLTARRCEIAELERLAGTSALVDEIARFVHALQRERGMSNIFLASRGERFGAMRLAQIPECDALHAQVLHAFDALAQEGVQARNGARLFNRIAMTLDALDGLPQLRERIGGGAISPREATAGFVHLVAGLLAVAFEAVDSAGDPAVSRALVAMFHFMQGKEYAGQERALGSAVFATGRIDAEGQQQWRHLIQQQSHCLDVFKEHADPHSVAFELSSSDHGSLVQLERLRRIGHALATMPVDETQVDEWYECCTARLDAMRSVEEVLGTHLRSLCAVKIAQARESLRDEEATLERLHHDATSNPPDAPSLIGPRLQRSVLDMVHEQSRRLQAMGDELENARAVLNERKLIERAKGLLMASRHASEDEAYRMLRQMAMNQKRRVVDVAQAVLAMADVLPPRPR